MLLPIAPKGYNLTGDTLQVAHWAPRGMSPSLMANAEHTQWVMIGSNKNVINYMMSGVGGPRVTGTAPFIRSAPYPYRNSSLTEVNRNQLIWPSGMERWKGMFGQRIYKP